jgi:hypothetical protein
MATSRGKIGRLPENARDELNRMIRDNREAEDIIVFCAEHGAVGVTPQNVSAWKKYGYARWLKTQERIDHMAARRAMAREMIDAAKDDGDGAMTAASDAASAMAVELLTDVLEDFEPDVLRGAIAEKPQRMLQLIETLTSIRKRDQDAVVLRQKVADYERKQKQLADVIGQNGMATKEDFDAIYRDAYGVKG